MSHRPHRICMVATKFYATSDMGGGLERSARQLFQELMAHGHQVIVLTRNYDRLPARETIEGVDVHRFRLWGRGRVLTSLSFLLQALWWLLRHRREYDVIHGHQSYAPATIGGLAKLLLAKPVIVKVSTADQFSERRVLEGLRFFPLRRYLLRQVDRFVTVNRGAADEFIGLGIGATKLIHIPNGVQIPTERALDVGVQADARRRLGLPLEGPMVTFVGRLSTEKNLPILVQAWAQVLGRVPNARLFLIGDGGTFRSVEASLRQDVLRMQVESSVVLTGRVTQVGDYLLASDLFVLPSSTEGMSNALLEAMAAGLPIVATRIPGNTAVIDHEVHGLLVEPQDASMLAAAIEDLLLHPDRAREFAMAARQRAQERFTLPRVGAAYRALYAELIPTS